MLEATTPTRRLLSLGLLAAAPLLGGEALAGGDRWGRLLEPRLEKDELFAESFFALADLEDGTYVKVQLGISNAGPGDGKGLCRLTVIDAKAKSWSAQEIVEQGKWRWEHQPAPRLTMGPCEAVVNDGLTVRAQVGGGTFEMKLEGDPAKARQHLSRVDVGDAFYELEVLLPWAPARVKLARPGEAPRELAGHGYSDHSRSTVLPSRLAERWVRFRALRGGDTRLLLVRFPAGGGAGQGWLWPEKVGQRGDVRDVDVQSRGPAKAKEWRVLFEGAGGPWRITSTQLLERHAPVEEQGMLGAVVRKLIGNPVTYTYRAVLEDKATRSKIPGIFEVTLANE